MIDCPNGDVRDLLPDFLHGRLDPSRHAEVEQHLARCEACRDELSLLRDLRATMGRVPRVQVHSIAAAIPPYRAPVRRSWGTGWRTAAAIAAVAVGGLSIALLRDGRAPSKTPAPSLVAVRADSQRPRDSASALSAALDPSAGVAGARSTEPSTPHVGSTATGGPELAMAGGAIGELSDGELAALVEGIESLDALPSTEVDGSEPVRAGMQEALR